MRRASHITSQQSLQAGGGSTCRAMQEIIGIEIGGWGKCLRKPLRQRHCAGADLVVPRIQAMVRRALRHMADLISPRAQTST